MPRKANEAGHKQAAKRTSTKWFARSDLTLAMTGKVLLSLVKARFVSRVLEGLGTIVVDREAPGGDIHTLPLHKPQASILNFSGRSFGRIY